MRLLLQDGDRFEFRFSRRELEVFRNTLEAYPVTPPGCHQLSRGMTLNSQDSDQALLSDAMASLKVQGRKRLETFLANGQRFVRDASGCRLVVNREEIEWLLQVLNDVRVGSWMRLGAPDPGAGKQPSPASAADPEAIRHEVLMEVAAHFQYALLAATDGTSGAGWSGRET